MSAAKNDFGDNGEHSGMLFETTLDRRLGESFSNVTLNDFEDKENMLECFLDHFWRKIEAFQTVVYYDFGDKRKDSGFMVRRWMVD